MRLMIFRDEYQISDKDKYQLIVSDLTADQAEAIKAVVDEFDNGVKLEALSLGDEPAAEGSR